MDKQKEFLDKVLERILKETDIDYEKDRIFTPFSPNSCNFRIIPVEEWSTKTLLHRLLRRQCKNIYGLTDEEINYVWDNYKNILRDITENGGYLNENVDKQKNFYDKVLERLLKDTVITDSKITFPFAIFKQEELTGDSLLSVSIWMDGRWENHKYPHRFKKYVNDIYGITYEESVILWRRYMDIIEKEVLKRLRQNSSGIRVSTTWNLGRHDINESHVDDTEFIKDYTKDLNEKQKGYLDKVVEQLLRETDIYYEKWRVNYPFFENTTYSFQYTLPFSGPFIRYCKKIYGLTKDELRYVHIMYIGILHGKIREYYVDNDIYNKYYNVMGTKTIINFDR